MKTSGIEMDVSAQTAGVQKTRGSDDKPAVKAPVETMSVEREFTPGDLAYNELAPEDEFEMLMSLALDDRLTPAEAARFEALLAQGAADLPENGRDIDRAAQWEIWQEMDTLFDSTPAAAPPGGFSAGVLQQIAWQERRKRLWLGAAIGVAAVLLWGTALLGVLGLVALVSANQALWLGEMTQLLAYWWTAAAGFFVSALRSAAAILATAQARAVIMVYCVVATGMLGLWWLWLQRTTQLDQMEFDNNDAVH